MKKNLSESILSELDRSSMSFSSKINEAANNIKSNKMNSIKYETTGYTEATNGMYKGKPIVDYHEKDFKKGASVLTPFVCGNCGKEFYVKSSVHDFFKQGDFDDPYEVPKESFGCPKCKNFDNLEYNGEVLIKEPGETNTGESDTIKTKKYRRSEFNKIDLGDGNYKIKIISSTGETKWLDITENEFAQIEKILTL